jgi:predicted nucleic acid-binding protein
MIVIADTSPINYLLLIGHIEILPYFYHRVFIPPSVWEELHDADTPEIVQAWIAHPPEWLEKRELSNPPDSSLDFLDRGAFGNLLWPTSAVCFGPPLER